MKKQISRHLCVIGVMFFALSSLLAENSPLRSNTPLFITDIHDLEDGSFWVTEKGARRMTHYSATFDKIIGEYQFQQVPTGLTVTKEKIYVTLFETHGSVVVIDRSTGKSEVELKVGSGANTPLYNQATGDLYVLNQFSNTISVIDPIQKRVKREVPVAREPKGAVLDRSGRYLFVTNFLPAQRADIDTVAAEVSVVDTRSYKVVRSIPLCNGSNALRGICLSPDGEYIFVTHNLGRFQVPTNQLQQGWMNTSAMSLIKVKTQQYEGTILLDEPERGAAGIWGIACDADRDRLVISHSGTHDVSIVRYTDFIRKFESSFMKKELAYDLRFLYDLRVRIPLMGNGPREFVINNGVCYVPTYFSDTLNLVDLRSEKVSSIALVANRQETEVQKGEKYFNDATYCFQNWQSCNGCHPGDGRMDGLNWDLMNDGVGNSKNCKSLLFSHVTPPSMISGIRESAELAVRKGFNLIQFYQVPESKAKCVDDYLRSLRPVPSPYLVDGGLSPKALKGKTIFDKLNCGSCHSGPYFTNQKMYRIGERVEFEKGWDTPTLIEVWRTAPYLFDGRAATMLEVFEKYRHGIEGEKISRKELQELTEYVNSL